MKIDIKTEIRSALLENPALVTLLGGQRVYQLAGPDAEEFPRITFFEIANTDREFADDEAYASDVSVQIDIWNKGSTSAISGEVDKTMKEQDWSRTGGGDFYEDDTKVYHKALRYRGAFMIEED